MKKNLIISVGGVLFFLSTICFAFTNKITKDVAVTDIDGNVYNTVTIGTQVWMVENLKTTKFNDGTSIPNITEGRTWSNLKSPSYCFYNNNVANKNTYGALYNWYAVNTGKLAPTGWHVPTLEEWETLENYLIAIGFNYDGTNNDNKIAKSLAATTGWKSDSGTGTIGNDLTKNNTSGFAGLPGGKRGSTYNGIGISGNWWSSTEDITDFAWFLPLIFGAGSGGINSTEVSCGLSVRCLQEVVIEEEPVYDVEQKPQFPGGDEELLKFIKDNLNYPAVAAKVGIEGRVTMRLEVNRNGDVTDVTVIRELDPSCDQEAVRIVKMMPRWIPGRQNGQNVPAYYTLPIIFKLNN